MDEIAEAIEIKPIGPDDLAGVRYIHAAAFRMLARQQFTEEQISAFTAYVYTHNYTSALSEAVRTRSLFGAWLSGELVGTAGWSAADGLGAVARVRWVYVRPLFTQLGIGTRLIEEVEMRARQAGFQVFAAEAPLNAIDFFRALGYHVSSHGVRALAHVEGLQVAFMRKGVAGQPGSAGADKAWH